jgi:FKBP-type peptidyl-prolyl cis-trans isomerase
MALGVLKEAAPLLRPGARYRFEAPPALVFGARDQGPDLPPNSVTVWELEMVRVIRPLPVPEFRRLDPAKTTTRPSGLKIEVVKEGGGAAPTAAAPVTVHYAGWLEDGTLFDSSYARGEPSALSLRGVIPGWTEGLATTKEGGVYLFEIPGGLAYGPAGRPPKIPPNATLIFRIEVIKAGAP